jgi:hypothetical protein
MRRPGKAHGAMPANVSGQHLLTVAIFAFQKAERYETANI